MASPNQQLLQHDTEPQPQPATPDLDPDTETQITVEPTPEVTVTVTPQATVMATATIAEHNPNSDTPMSEPPMAVPILVTGQTQPSSNSSTRRLPPPCWTPDETATLIDAYREKWYALRRGNLRAAHWEEVADDIHAACPDVSPPKTAVQCRHKMEKLRKRYRTELQRAKSIPHHRFSSSWIYFSRMQTMEKNGSPSAAAASPGVSLSSPQPPPSAVSTAVVNVDDYNGGGEYMEEDDAVAVDDDDDEDFTLRSYKQQPKTGFSSRNFQPVRVRVAGNNSNRNVNYGDYDDNSPMSVPNLNPNPSSNYGLLKGNYGLKSGYANNYGSPPPQFNGSQSRFEKNRNHNASGLAGPSGLGMGMGIGMGMNYMNVNSMSGGGGGGSSNKKRKMVTDNGVEKRGKERGDEAALEMVDAIRMLGEGFVRMEKMKMEMMRETERVRMEMEMKRTEMLLDSQHRIVEAFAKAWTDGFSNKE